jgi:hypothetical protein
MERNRQNNRLPKGIHPINVVPGKPGVYNKIGVFPNYREDSTTIPGHPGVHSQHKTFKKSQGPLRKARKALRSFANPRNAIRRYAGGLSAPSLALGGLGRVANHLMNPARSNRIGYMAHAALKSRR